MTATILKSAFLNGFVKDTFIDELQTAINPAKLISIEEKPTEYILEIAGYVSQAEIDAVVLAHQPVAENKYSAANLDKIDVNQNYNILGLFEEIIESSLGDVVTKNLYRNFDVTKFNQETGVMSEGCLTGKAVEEVLTYHRNTSGILYKRDHDVKYYGLDGVMYLRKQWSDFYTIKKGYAKNQESFKNLLDKASMYLTSQAGLTASRRVLRDLASEVTCYSKGDREPLLTAIANSTDECMTVTIKQTLNLILNVNYA